MSAVLAALAGCLVGCLADGRQRCLQGRRALFPTCECGRPCSPLPLRRICLLPHTRAQDLQARASYNATVEEMLEAVRERLPALDVPWTLGEVQVRSSAGPWAGPGGTPCLDGQGSAGQPAAWLLHTGTSPAAPRPPQACHISSWNASHLAQHEHITSQRDPALRQVRRPPLLPAAAVRYGGTRPRWRMRTLHRPRIYICPPTAHPRTRPQRLRPVLMADPEIGPRLCQLGRMFGYPPEPECAGTPAATAAEGGTAGSQGAAAGAAAMSEPPEAAASGAAAGGGGGGGGEAGVVEQGEMQD